MPRRKQKHRKQKGRGFLQDVDKFLKDTKILSNVGSVLLPIAGGAAGTFFAPGVGTAVGAAGGESAAQGLKALGYGRRRKRMRGRGILPNAYNSVNNIGSAVAF